MTTQEKKFVSEEKVQEQKMEMLPIFWLDDITLRERLHKHGVIG